MNLDVLGPIPDIAFAAGEIPPTLQAQSLWYDSVLHPYIRKLASAHPVGDVAMTEFLDNLIDAAIHGYKPELEQIEIPIGADFKWRYSSAFQKGVRRGDDSVVLAALAMEKCDNTYLWKRMSVIAVEDIAMGDPWVVALVIHCCRFKKVRDRHGAGRLSAFLGQLMGSALKDRTACDLYCTPYAHPKMTAPLRQMATTPPTELVGMFMSDEVPTGFRMAAGWTMAAKRWGAEDRVFHTTGGDPELLMEAIDAMVPGPFSWIARRYASMNRDPMWISMMICQRLYASSTVITKEPGEIPERVLIDGILSATFDGFTREGKRALSYFNKSCDAVAEFFRQYPTLDPVKCIRLASFTADSSLLDRYVMFDGASQIYQTNLEGEAADRDISYTLLAELVQLIAQNRPLLDAARRKVL